MQINSIQGTTFGQIFVSQPMKEKIKSLYSSMPENTRPNKATFNRNWKRCQNTSQFDILISNDQKVFLLDKSGQRIMEEKMLSTFVWNIDSALKRVLLFEDAQPNGGDSKYENYYRK